MTVRATMEALLVDHGLTPAQAELTLDQIARTHPEMRGRWEEEATDFECSVDDRRQAEGMKRLAMLTPRTRWAGRFDGRAN